jgi:predicted metal-binding protein
MHLLLICRTCPRDMASSGMPGDALAASLSESAASCGVQVLRVNCLGSCRQPCTVALDEPTKCRLRFSNLEAGDAGDLEKVVRQYCMSDTGRIAAEGLPPTLRGRLTAVAPKTILSSSASVSAVHPSLHKG